MPAFFSRMCAIISAKNEEESIGNVIRQLYRSGIRHAVIVGNGCSDKTPAVVNQLIAQLNVSFRFIQITESLGPDVPKAIGTFIGLRCYPLTEWFVYVDGDWKGSFGPMLEDFLIRGVNSGDDMWFVPASPNVREHGQTGKKASSRLYRLDEQLWKAALARYNPPLQHIGPSRLPMLVQRSVFTRLSPHWLHHPGKWFALCAREPQSVLRIGCDTRWSTHLIGNPTRDHVHSKRMLETLVGDTVEGCCILSGRRLTRVWKGIQYDGYNSERRLDVLNSWQALLVHHTE